MEQHFVKRFLTSKKKIKEILMFIKEFISIKFEIELEGDKFFLFIFI